MTRVSAADICRVVKGRILNEEILKGPGASAFVDAPAPLDSATETQVAFFFSKDYQTHLLKTKAGIVLTGDAFAAPLLASGLPLLNKTVFIACADPYRGMAQVTALFAPSRKPSGVHATAVVHPTARVADSATIGAYGVVGADCEIGSGSVLHEHVSLGAGVRIGSDCDLFSGVTLYEQTQIGNRVRIHANSVIGADGFGYAPKIIDGKVAQHEKIWHFGRVRIEDDVEIGALSSIDRATFGETVIQKGSKIDNNVHVGHNANVGEGVILCGGVGLAGTASVGKFVYVGGLAGINNKTHVGEYSKVAGMSQVMKDVPDHSEWGGYPARDIKDYFKMQAFLAKLYREYKDKRKKTS